MESWSTRRRFIYGGSVLLVLAIILGVAFFKVFYKAPTCMDGVRNGDEKGIDCGGSCINLCTSETLTPIVLWSEIFNISGDVYSAVAYVENPNISSKNRRAEYQFQIYDENNKLITVVDGQTSIPKNKKFAVFETGIVLRGSKPKTSSFEFKKFSVWERDTEEEPELFLEYSALLFPTTTPRITGMVKNQSTKTVPELELAVLVLDGNENVVAASRSFVENLSPKMTQDFVFTWPKPFNLGVEACINPVDVIVALDKSGSMKSESSNPPEPFNTVIATAKDFVGNLKEEDQVGVVSFGDSSILESALSFNKDFAVNAISNMFLSDKLEQTNITAGLTSAFDELKSNRSKLGSKRALILLTDGVPTEPKKEGVSDYPVISAQGVSTDMKNSGVHVYTIGLGQNIGEGFLKTISTDDSHYFFAPTKNDLSAIYKKIADGLCTKKPNAITVIYRTL